jgi:hypothetical protein
MNVIVMTHMPVQVADFERVVKEQADTLVAVSAEGKAAGAIHHMFVEDANGQIMVIDEWDNEDSFHQFFDNQKDIPAMMGAAGLAGAPTTTAYRIIDTPDQF